MRNNTIFVNKISKWFENVNSWKLLTDKQWVLFLYYEELLYFNVLLVHTIYTYAKFVKTCNTTKIKEETLKRNFVDIYIICEFHIETKKLYD